MWVRRRGGWKAVRRRGGWKAVGKTAWMEGVGGRHGGNDEGQTVETMRDDTVETTRHGRRATRQERRRRRGTDDRAKTTRDDTAEIITDDDDDEGDHTGLTDDDGRHTTTYDDVDVTANDREDGGTGDDARRNVSDDRDWDLGRGRDDHTRGVFMERRRRKKQKEKRGKKKKGGGRRSNKCSCIVVVVVVLLKDQLVFRSHVTTHTLHRNTTHPLMLLKTRTHCQQL
jgi:hypothetical protein